MLACINTPICLFLKGHKMLWKGRKQHINYFALMFSLGATVIIYGHPNKASCCCQQYPGTGVLRYIVDRELQIRSSCQIEKTDKEQLGLYAVYFSNISSSAA